MKILVDNIPLEPYKCPYCKDESDMDMERYVCEWNNCGYECHDTSECPFFCDSNTLMDNKIYEHENNYFHEYKS